MKSASSSGSTWAGVSAERPIANSASPSKGVWIGRPYLYGLGAGGKAGVTRTLEILRTELDTTMALCGRRDIRGIDAAILDQGTPVGMPVAKTTMAAA